MTASRFASLTREFYSFSPFSPFLSLSHQHFHFAKENFILSPLSLPFSLCLTNTFILPKKIWVTPARAQQFGFIKKIKFKNRKGVPHQLC